MIRASLGDPSQNSFSTASPPRPQARLDARPRVDGKFLFIGEQKLTLRGVTYGTFAPDSEGHQFPPRQTVDQDFGLMHRCGLTAVRVYTPPPLWLLDAALANGLRVLVGLPWEQHVAFLDGEPRRKDIESRVRAAVRACAGHPAILAFAVGNEIPSSVVRWYGRRRVEKFLSRLCRAVKSQDPGALVTYVNFPSTEYLRLPFLDFVCFNVYLESREKFEAYLYRLHTLAGDRPLVMAEIGMDSRRNGLEAQASALGWQVETAAAAGCAGTFLFAWTDEWWRGGHSIEDWDFGLTTRARDVKPALLAATHSFAETPFPSATVWPGVSVVVCTYNGSRTLEECLRNLVALEYPEYEVIVVNDGSTDRSAEIARGFPVKLISTANQGLSAARNVGLEAATREILVYIDDDAYPDPHWLQYLTHVFRTTGAAAAGGPNIAPRDDGDLAECVVNAPGGPVHVLFTDTEAEHVPGCNMAFRRERLVDIGGFDPQFRAAGDDVDVCWRILQRGWTIGFHPAAFVWHHRRNSVRAYWRQQRGYGRAEAMLERKWPEKYNAIGHISWGGRLYGKGLTHILGQVSRVYHGPWGSAPFQGLQETPPSLLSVLPTMPEWYLVIIALAGISALGFAWSMLFWALPLFLAALGATLVQALLSAADAPLSPIRYSWPARVRLRGLIAVLHITQPLVRLLGRAGQGLTALRMRMPGSLMVPVARSRAIWSEVWRSPEQGLQYLASVLRRDGAVLLMGGEFDRWELEVRGGLLGAARLFMVVEEHGAGRQMFRFRYWPRFSREGVVAILGFTLLSAGAALEEYWFAYDILAGVGLILLGRALYEAASAMGALDRAIRRGFKGNS